MSKVQCFSKSQECGIIVNLFELQSTHKITKDVIGRKHLETNIR